MRALLLMLGIPDMPTWQFVIFLGCVGVALLLLGWIADMTLGEGGFGTAVNGVLILIGAIGGVFLWNKYGVPLHIPLDPRAAKAIAAAAAGTMLLLVLAVMRRWL